MKEFIRVLTISENLKAFFLNFLKKISEFLINIYIIFKRIKYSMIMKHFFYIPFLNLFEKLIFDYRYILDR